MNEGVKILLERMKTNPEEFIADGYSMTKWGGLISQYRDYLNEEDKKALTDALNEITQQRFTEAVMKELLAPEEDDNLGKWFTKQPTGMPLGGATQGVLSSQYQAAQAQAQQAQLAHIQLHQQALAAQNSSVTWSARQPLQSETPVKKHKTLFGKLFNYS